MKLLSILILLLLSYATQAQIIRTFASNGTPGYTGDGGPATAATTRTPVGVCIDTFGNVYFAEYSNHIIRKVNTTGVISTFAGTGIPGYSGDGGPATAAQFNVPWNIALDKFGNMFVTEQTNNVIRKINPAGIITTYAGNGFTGYSGDGGPATAAEFFRPSDIAVDDTGNIYFGDGNQVIRKVDINGIITTFAGNGSGGFSGDGGPALNARLNNPISVVWGNGGLYIGDNLNNRIRKVDALTGIITTVVGTGIAGYSGDGGSPLAARINGPLGLALDAAGNLYIAEYTTNVIRKISTITETIAGTSVAGFSGDGGPALLARMNQPWGIKTKSGVVYFSDVANNRVRAITTCGGIITGSVAVCAGNTITLSNSIAGATWSSGNTVVATVGPGSGIVTGVAPGLAVISSFYGSGCVATTTVTVTSPPGLISGVTALCAGFSILLSNATPGGTWTAANTSIATVNSGTGVVTGVAAGSTTITYATGVGCYATVTISISPSPSAITGGSGVCLGGTIQLSNALGGGTWSSLSSAIATIHSTSGTVTGIAPGNALITYSVASGCFTTITISVSPQPVPFTAVFAVCSGATITLSNAVAGGTWNATNTTVATVNAAIGTITGIAPGITTIQYTMPGGCFETATIIVNPSPGAITGNPFICIGNATTLSNNTAGGTWSSSAPAIAAVGSSTGVITSLGTGTAIITYSLPTGCFAVVTSIVSPAPLPIAGNLILCAGSTTTLSNAVPMGAWSTDNTLLATVGAATGVLTGVAAGTTIISYTMPGGCYETATITVMAAPTPITSASAMCVGSAITLSNATPGGSWTSGSASVSVSAGSGVVTAISIGSALISYTMPSGCYVTTTVAVIGLPGAISGGDLICTASSVVLSNSVAGGIWSSSTSTVATVGATSGIVTGVSAGTTNITYALSGCFVTTTVTVKKTPTALFDSDMSFCTGTQQVIGATVTPITATYLWSDGTTDSTITVNAEGTYTLVVINDGCSTVAVAHVSQLPQPARPRLGNDTTVCNDRSLTLYTHVGPARWNNAVIGSTYDVFEEGAYHATITNACGSATDTINVYYDFCNLGLPNAFSPNGDGINDYFRAIGGRGGLEGFSMAVYDRWGVRLFYTTHIDEGWDGKYKGVTQDGGVYFYFVSYKMHGQEKTVKGDITIVK